MSKKDVIYIDIEDDITAIIDKVKASKAEIVALVPPKRSSVLQSAVNMKLLKRTADKDSKKLVLISTEAGLMPLAGGVGLFMADSLQSRPKIPDVEKADLDDSVIEDEELVDDEAQDNAPAAVAGAAATAAVVAASRDKEEEPAAKAATKAKKKPKAKNEKLDSLKSGSKIPNFSKFRLRMILIGAGLLLLIVLWFLGFRIFPSADVTIQAQTKRVPVDTNFTADTDSQTNIDDAVLEADQQTLTKSITEEFDATGEKDVGQKATGTITIQNCYSSTNLDVPAGTTFTDPSTGNKFTSNTAAKVPGGVFVGECTTPGEKSVSVTAAESGDDKNLSPRSYSVSGFGGKVTGYGDQMSGGTTKKIKVVSEADVAAATKKLNERTHEAEKEELAGKFDDDSYVLTNSFIATAGQISASPDVGSEASKAIVTSQYTYTMLGVQRDSINQLLEKQEKDQLGDSEQSILETGLDDADVGLLSQASASNMTFNIKTDGYAGPEIDTEALKEEIKNKRYSEAISIIEGKEGVNTVRIDLSPFWVSHVPGRTNKININIEVSDQPSQ